MTPIRIDYHYTVHCSKCWKSIKVTPTLEKNAFSSGDGSIECPKCGTAIKLPQPVSITCSNCGYEIHYYQSEYEYLLCTTRAKKEGIRPQCPNCGIWLSNWNLLFESPDYAGLMNIITHPLSVPWITFIISFIFAIISTGSLLYSVLISLISACRVGQ